MSCSGRSCLDHRNPSNRSGRSKPTCHVTISETDSFETQNARSHGEITVEGRSREAKYNVTSSRNGHLKALNVTLEAWDSVSFRPWGRL